LKPPILIEKDIQKSKRIKYWGRVLANTLTLSRLLMVPLILYQHERGAFLACFGVMVWIGVSDILDGFVARKFNCSTFFGGILDAGVDFIVLLALCIFYCRLEIYPWFLLILMALSFGLFVFWGVKNKAITKSRVGKYSGTALYFGLTLSIGARAFFPDIIKTADRIAVFVSMTVLAISIFENIIEQYKRIYH
jgi:phosphatidylglycerophosphate synthase